MKKISFFKKILLPILAILLLTVSMNVFRVKLGYCIERTKKETARLRIENDYLEKKITYECSLKKLQEYAEAMQLKYPEPYSIVILEEIKSQKARETSWLALLFSKKSKTDI